MIDVHTKARRILKAFEPIVSRKIMVQRQKVYELEKCLSPEDKEKFPLRTRSEEHTSELQSHA